MRYVIGKPVFSNRPLVGTSMPKATIEWVPDLSWGIFETNILAKRRWVEGMGLIAPGATDQQIIDWFRPHAVNTQEVKILKWNK